MKDWIWEFEQGRKEVGLDNWNREKRRQVKGNMKVSSLYEEGGLGLLFKKVVLFWGDRFFSPLFIHYVLQNGW